MGLALCPFLVLHCFQSNERTIISQDVTLREYVRTRREQSHPVSGIFSLLPIRKLGISQARSCIRLLFLMAIEGLSLMNFFGAY